MSVSREGLLPSFVGTSADAALPPLPTIAEPPLFAPPVEVHEEPEDAALVIVFLVAAEQSEEHTVEAWGRHLFVWGPRCSSPGDAPIHRPMRVYALPFDMLGRALETRREGALLTDARQLNKNLLLSAAAHIDTKPELEIFADDVKCSHGATVGQLENEELFYLASRGISRDEAPD